MNRFISSLFFNDKSYFYYDLKKIFELYPSLKKLPNSLKILLEMNLRNSKDLEEKEIIDLFLTRNNLRKINFYPNRVIMCENNASSSLVLFSSLRDLALSQNKDVKKINPFLPVDVILDEFSFKSEDIRKNEEKYRFFKWVNFSFNNVSVLPPSIYFSKINIEQLSTMISAKTKNEKTYLYPEVLISSDKSVKNVNSLGVVGLKTNHIALEKVMLGENISFSFPSVIGIELLGSFSCGVSINDLISYLNNKLKDLSLKGKIIEIYGTGLKNLNIKSRALICDNLNAKNALFIYFQMDDITLRYIEKTRNIDISLIRDYYRRIDVFENNIQLEYEENIKIDLLEIKPIVFNMKNINSSIKITELKDKFTSFKKGNYLKDNDIVFVCLYNIDLISLVQSALLLKRAKILQLTISKNIKKILLINTFFKEYLEKIDLYKYFEYYEFELNMDKDYISEKNLLDIQRFNLNVSALYANSLGIENLNYIQSSWVISPLLLVTYCFKGNLNFDISSESICNDIYLSDLAPSYIEIEEYLQKVPDTFYVDIYKNYYLNNEYWKTIPLVESDNYFWDENSTYIQPYTFDFKDEIREKIEINSGKIFALFDDNIDKELFFYKGDIALYSSLAFYLKEKGLRPDEYNTIEKRKSNLEAMKKSILTNPRLKNKMTPLKTGSFTKNFESDEILSFYDYSIKNKSDTFLIFAGSNFGLNVDNDFCAKVLFLFGIEIIVAKSFDENFRKDLISVGILPLEFLGDDIELLNLKGDEKIFINSEIITKSNSRVEMKIVNKRSEKTIILKALFQNLKDFEYYKNFGYINLSFKNFFT